MTFELKKLQVEELDKDKTNDFTQLSYIYFNNNQKNGKLDRKKIEIRSYIMESPCFVSFTNI